MKKDWLHLTPEDVRDVDLRTCRQMLREHSKALSEDRHMPKNLDLHDIKLAFVEALAYAVGEGEITKEQAANITRKAGVLALQYGADRKETN